MSPRLRRRISRLRDGRYALRIDDDERSLLGGILAELREALVVHDDPSLMRIFPPAYANDPDRNAEYEVLTRDDLLERRLAGIEVVESTLQADVLDENQILHWMGAVNDLRLVLGTRLDVTEETALPDPDDPNAPAYFLYHYLGNLLGEIVDAVDG
jgi:hypothetical protein